MSASLLLWQGPAQEVFAELELAHRTVGGHGRGERLLTRQINYAYVTALAAQFQRYCRAVHTEVALALVAGVPDPRLAFVFETHLIQGRRLDRGNPNPANLGADFGRFGLDFWGAILDHGIRNERRRAKLETLIGWRNAIGHGDIGRKREKGELAPDEIRLDICRDWRSALGQLVFSIDDVLASHCETLGFPRPW